MSTQKQKEENTKWVMLMERGGRRCVLKSSIFNWCGLYKNKTLLAVGVSDTDMTTAIIKCVKEYVRKYPIGDLANELYRSQQRANLKWIKSKL